MSDTFESLWAECSEPSDRDDGERRDLADLFWRSGAAAERERIRLELLELIETEAQRVEGWQCKTMGGCSLPRHVGHVVDVPILRAFARRLEPKREEP